MATQDLSKTSRQEFAEFINKHSPSREGRGIFKNTLAPNVVNDYLSVGTIINGLKQSAFRFDDLPPRVRRAVNDELKRREK